MGRLLSELNIWPVSLSYRRRNLNPADRGGSPPVVCKSRSNWLVRDAGLRIYWLADLGLPVFADTHWGSKVMKRQLLSILGLGVFIATLLSVSVSNCFAQAALPDGILPATEENEEAVARTTWVMLTDGSRLIVELDPMTAFRITFGDEEREFYPNDFSTINLNRRAGTAVVQFTDGETLTGELEFDDLLVDTTWGGQLDIEGDFITSIRSTDASTQTGTTVIFGGPGGVVVEGRVIIYADRQTEAIRQTVAITQTRRSVQIAYNKISKP